MTTAETVLGVPATPPAAAPAGTPAGETPPAADWATLFAGEDPAKVKEALGHARTWESRAKENGTAAAELAALRDTTRTAEQKLADERAATAGKLTAAEVRAARLSVALAKGLTVGQAGRLVGTTEAEMLADADALLAEFRGTQTPEQVAAAAETARRAALVNPLTGSTPGTPPGLNEDSLLEALKGALNIAD